MKVRVRTVRVHSKDAAPTDIFDVVSSQLYEGMLTVIDARDNRWRFPIADIGMVVETPTVKKTMEKKR